MSFKLSCAGILSWFNGNKDVTDTVPKPEKSVFQDFQSSSNAYLILSKIMASTSGKNLENKIK